MSHVTSFESRLNCTQENPAQQDRPLDDLGKETTLHTTQYHEILSSGVEWIIIKQHDTIRTSCHAKHKFAHMCTYLNWSMQMWLTWTSVTKHLFNAVNYIQIFISLRINYLCMYICKSHVCFAISQRFYTVSNWSGIFTKAKNMYVYRHKVRLKMQTRKKRW